MILSLSFLENTMTLLVEFGECVLNINKSRLFFEYRQLPADVSWMFCCICAQD